VASNSHRVVWLSPIRRAGILKWGLVRQFDQPRSNIEAWLWRLSRPAVATILNGHPHLWNDDIAEG
jgi:hypothetical protein